MNLFSRMHGISLSRSVWAILGFFLEIKKKWEMDGYGERIISESKALEKTSLDL